MKTRAIPRLLTAAVALGFAMIVASHAYAQANTNVRIDTLAIEGTTLTITGKNFGSSPAVFVGDTTLVVSHSNDTEIVAVTPQLERGIHLVKVVRDANAGGSSASTLQIQ